MIIDGKGTHPATKEAVTVCYGTLGDRRFFIVRSAVPAPTCGPDNILLEQGITGETLCEQDFRYLLQQWQTYDGVPRKEREEA
jgi:hypothetical protein